jgi:hypothetical protein
MGVILTGRCPLSSDKGLISKAYNDLHRLTKEKNPIDKWSN